MSSTNIVKSVDNMGVWADKINAVMSNPCASIAAGVTTYFDDINEMFATTAAGTSYIIRTGEYTLTSQLYFDNLDNVSIAGVGGPVVFNLTMPSGANSKGATFQYCENISVTGITFRLQANVSNYGSLNAYTVTANSNSGSFKGCTFIAENTLTTAEMVPIDHMIAFTQTEAADRNVVVEDCVFIAIPTAVSSQAITQCIATHGGTLDQIPTFINCKLIIPKAHMEGGGGDVIIATNAILQNCLTSVYDSTTTECGLMTEKAAEAYIPSDLKTYFDGYKRAHSTSQGAVYIWSETPTATADAWYTVASIMPNTYADGGGVRTPYPAFTVEIDGFEIRSDSTDYMSVKYAMRYNALTELYRYNSGSRMQAIWDGPSNTLLIQIKVNSSIAEFNGTVRLLSAYTTVLADDTTLSSEGFLRIYETALEV